MKITITQLKQLIKEEVGNVLVESEDKIRKLLDSEYPSLVMQGIEISELLGLPIIFNNAPPAEVNFYIKEIDNPDIISLMISNEQNVIVLYRLASNKNLTGEMMSKLLNFNSGRINFSIARNESVTTEILDTLSAGEDTRVTRAVAQHPKTSTETLARMADRWFSDDSYTLEAIYNNPNVSDETLLKGAHNPFGYPREVAEKVLKSRQVEIPVYQDKFSDEEFHWSDDDYDSEDDDYEIEN